MNKAYAVLFALMMLTVSLAGCIGGDDPVEDETPVENIRIFDIKASLDKVESVFH